MATGPSSEPRISRNLIERGRRSQMKNLFANLFNLLPPPPTKMSIPELVEHATIYVTQLRKRMEELKQIKGKLEEETRKAASGGTRIVSPVIDITDLGSTMEVNLITAVDTKFVLRDIVSILEEGGAQVVGATYGNVGNKVILSIHSQAAYPRIGIDN